MDIKRLSLNSDGAFRTIIHRRTPQAKNNTSTETREKEILDRVFWMRILMKTAYSM